MGDHRRRLRETLKQDYARGCWMASGEYYITFYSIVSDNMYWGNIEEFPEFLICYWFIVKSVMLKLLNTAYALVRT